MKMDKSKSSSTKNGERFGFVGSVIDDHEFVIRLGEEKSGLQAYIGIHSTVLGPALGGTRFLHYQSDQEALDDALNLSRAMSYKCALAKLPFGGGKGVILAREGLSRKDLLLAYGHLVEKLRGLFKTGTDVGITDEDVRLMASQTTHMLGMTIADRRSLSTAKVAALGVFYAMKAALAFMYGSASFDGRKVAIKGVGKLGGELALLLSKAGAGLLIADVDLASCSSLKRRFPDITILPVEDIQQQEVDIYAPCALGNEFTEHSVAGLRCKAIVGGANNQLASPEVGDLIAQRGIVYAPDYVANAGGLIYVADELEPDGFNKERVLRRTEAIEGTISAILREAKDRNEPTNRVADLIAEEWMERAKYAK
ncbi:MAG: Leu/Phe/Val dehydrogenase [Candidatus Saccharimonadales bacterium]